MTALKDFLVGLIILIPCALILFGVAWLMNKNLPVVMPIIVAFDVVGCLVICIIWGRHWRGASRKGD